MGSPPIPDTSAHQAHTCEFSNVRTLSRLGKPVTSVVEKGDFLHNSPHRPKCAHRMFPALSDAKKERSPHTMIRSNHACCLCPSM